MKYLVLLGRVLFGAIFLFAAPHHFQAGTIAYAAAQGVPLAKIAVPLSGAMAIAGAVSIILGYKARWGAWLIVLFLIPVTLMMHNFWAAKDPQAYSMQLIMFMKNMSMLGAAFMMTQMGSGPLSLKD